MAIIMTCAQCGKKYDLSLRVNKSFPRVCSCGHHFTEMEPTFERREKILRKARMDAQVNKARSGVKQAEQKESNNETNTDKS